MHLFKRLLNRESETNKSHFKIEKINGKTKSGEQYNFNAEKKKLAE